MRNKIKQYIKRLKRIKRMSNDLEVDEELSEFITDMQLEYGVSDEDLEG